MFLSLLVHLFILNVPTIPVTENQLSLRKICENTGFSDPCSRIFPYNDKIVDSLLIRENKGQRKSLSCIFCAVYYCIVIKPMFLWENTVLKKNIWRLWSLVFQRHLISSRKSKQFQFWINLLPWETSVSFSFLFMICWSERYVLIVFVLTWGKILVKYIFLSNTCESIALQ